MTNPIRLYADITAPPSARRIIAELLVPSTTQTVTRLDHIRHDEACGYISADDAAVMRQAVLDHMQRGTQ